MPSQPTHSPGMNTKPAQPSIPNIGGVKPTAITMNFSDADIRVLIRFMSKLTGKNFLIDPRVQGSKGVKSPIDSYEAISQLC